METTQILAEIREANLSYLMLAQSLIRSTANRPCSALHSSEETARHDRASPTFFGADDEDRFRQHAAVPLPGMDEYPGLEPADLSHGASPRTKPPRACTPRSSAAARATEAA